MIDRHAMVDLFGPIVGDNWHAPELVHGASYRWTGPATVSRIRLPALGSGRLLIRWVLAFPPLPNAIRATRLRIDDRKVEIVWSLRDGQASFAAACEVVPARAVVMAQLTAPIISRGADARELGLAISRIEISRLAVDGIGLEADLLGAKLADRAREIALLRAPSRRRWVVALLERLRA